MSGQSSRAAKIIIAVGLVAALAAPLLAHLDKPEPQTRVIELKAKKYGYEPERIIVNQGDKVVLKPTSLDVTHGFLLDGYDVDAIIKQGGLAYLKYVWKDDEGKKHTDWDKVKEIEFTADKAGKFAYRCTQTCGNLHPFMVGELIVQDNTPYHFAVSISLWIGFALITWFLMGKDREPKKSRRDLLARWPLLGKIIKARSFQFWLILPNFVFFYLLILSALWGSPVGNRNIAIIFVWILWWTALKAILLPFGGRAWCSMCPLPAPAEWLVRKSITGVRYLQKPFRRLHHKFLGFNLDWPKWLTNGWMQNLLFLSLISFGIILITRPVATAILFITILVLTFALSLVFRGRAFCRFVCPVGGFLGTYSMAACSEIRVRDPEICKQHKEKECFLGGENGWACPWGRYPGKLGRNNYCGLCTECIKACPKDNISLFSRPFGSDLNLKGWDEAFNVFIMLAVALVFSITMLGPWDAIKRAANITEAGDWSGFAAYVGTIWFLGLGVVPGAFALAVQAGRKFSGSASSFRQAGLALAYVFIPVGIFAWIAFSLPQVMTNYGYILSILSDPLGLGWDILGTAKYPFHPFWPEGIPYIQGTLLNAGLYLGLKNGFRALKKVEPSRKTRAVLAIPAVLLTVLIINIFLDLYMA